MAETMPNRPQQRKQNQMHKQILFLLASVLMLASCNGSTLMHSYQPMNNNCWDRTDTITFDLPPMTTDDKCNLIIGLRVTNHFPYEVLILEIEQNYQNPMAHRTDTIKYPLTDKSGDFEEKGINYFLPIP